MINNLFAWIGIMDITPILALSPNTDESDLKLHVIDAQEIELQNLIQIELYQAINEAVKANYSQFKNGRTYEEGAKVFYNSAYYIALEQTTTSPEDAEFWTSYELMDFYYNFVKKWLATATVVRYLPFHGLHVTQFGLEEYTQEGFGQVSDKRRAEMLQNFKGKSDVYRTRMLNELDRVKSTFDGVKYEVELCRARKKRNQFTVLGIGNGR
jgi:hypothetical protein